MTTAEIVTRLVVPMPMAARKPINIGNIPLAFYTMVLGIEMFIVGSLEFMVLAILAFIGAVSSDALLVMAFMVAFVGLGVADAGALMRWITGRW